MISPIKQDAIYHRGRCALKSAIWMLALTQILACSNIQPYQQSTRSTIRQCTAATTLTSAAAFAEAKDILKNPACHVRFESLFKQLKILGADNPGEHNSQYFAGFINWSKKQGIITKTQASALYNRYFGEVFISLPSRGNICSHTLSRKPLQPDLDIELQQKREGFIEILGNKETFNQIYAQYQQLTFVLDMAEQACQS